MNILKSKRRTLLCFLLSAMILITGIPVLANVDGNTANGTGSVNEKIATPVVSDAGNYPQSPNQGYVRMTKSAEWTDIENGKAKVTFNVWGEPVDKGVDVVMIMDVSGSMSFGSKRGQYDETDKKCCDKNLTYEKTGIKWTLSDYLYTDNEKVKATCSKCGEVYNALTTTTNKVDNSTGKIYYDVAPYKARLNYAEEAAHAFTDTILANGKNNRMAFVGFAETVMPAHCKNFTSSNSEISSTIDGIKNYNGTTYSNALQQAKTYIESRTDKSRPVRIVFVTDGEPKDADRLQANPKYKQLAQQLKTGNSDYKAEIYTVGFGEEAGAGVFESIATSSSDPSEKFIWKDVKLADLTEVFKRIANNMAIAGTEAVLTDYINTEYFTITGDNVKTDPSDNTVSVDVTNNKVEWKVGNINEEPKQLTIHIQLKDNDISYNNKALPTNSQIAGQDASITYKNFNGVNCEQTVESPILSRPDGIVYVNFYLVDKDGYPINSNNTKIDFGNRIQISDTKHVQKDGSLGSATAILSGGESYSVGAPPTLSTIVTEPDGTVNQYNYAYVPNSSKDFVDKTLGQRMGQNSPFNFTVNNSFAINFGYKLVDVEKLYNIKYNVNTDDSSVTATPDAINNIPEGSYNDALLPLLTRSTKNDGDYIYTYTFKGWALSSNSKTPATSLDIPEDVNTGTDTVTLYGVWGETKTKIIKYTVNYDGNLPSDREASDLTGLPGSDTGLTDAAFDPAYTLDDGSQMVLASSDDYDYEFVGWSLDPADDTTKSSITLSDFDQNSTTITACAIWASKAIPKYNIEYIANMDGNVEGMPDTNPVTGLLAGEYTDEVSDVNLTKDKVVTENNTYTYEFKGWALSEDAVAADAIDKVVLPEDAQDGTTATLYGIWEVTENANPTITFLPGDAEDNAKNMPDPDSFKVEYNSLQQMYDYGIPSWKGHVFDGWIDQDTDSEYDGIPVRVTEDKTYIAKWIAAENDADLTHNYYDQDKKLVGSDGPNKTDITTNQLVKAISFANKAEKIDGFNSVPFKVEIINNSAITGETKTLSVKFNFRDTNADTGEMTDNEIVILVKVPCYNDEYVFTEEMFDDAYDQAVSKLNITDDDWYLLDKTADNKYGAVISESTDSIEYVYDKVVDAEAQALIDNGHSDNKSPDMSTGTKVVFEDSTLNDDYEFSEYGDYSIIASYVREAIPKKEEEKVLGEETPKPDSGAVLGEEAADNTDDSDEESVLGEEAKTSDSMNLSILISVMLVAGALIIVALRRRETE